MTRKCECKADGLSISTLPQPVLETILCLMPIQEAARTSILSKEWRYKWTKIPKLKFYLPLVSKTFTKEKQVQGKNVNKRSKPFYDLHQVLLSHQSPIQDLTISMDRDYDYVEFNQIILYLSTNHTIKKLKLYGDDVDKLPVSVFSLHHLSELNVRGFDLNHQLTFNVSGSLRSLVLRHVGISTKSLLHLLSSCSSLKSLGLLIGETHLGDEKCTIVELFKCLSMIESLTFFGHMLEFKWIVLDPVPQELPTLLFHLKYFCFKEMYFDDGQGLVFLLRLIKCSPNLEKIKLEINWDYDGDDDFTVWEEYSDVWLEHLVELEIDWFSDAKHEMEFVKFILSKSPKLKKVSLKTGGVSVGKRMEMLQVLL